MTWYIRSAAAALAMFVLGTAWSGVSAASTVAPGVEACAPAAGTSDAGACFEPLGRAVVGDSAGSSTVPGAGSGSVFAGEDGTGDIGRGTVGTAVVPRNVSFATAFDRHQYYPERSFLAPQPTGPPAA